ncbi:hypothetical protein EV128_119110 [Rhizobium azibense]|nr:hypothetical protein EV128_119110 [Rhizobium azibense]
MVLTLTSDDGDAAKCAAEERTERIDARQAS